MKRIFRLTLLMILMITVLTACKTPEISKEEYIEAESEEVTAQKKGSAYETDKFPNKDNSQDPDEEAEEVKETNKDKDAKGNKNKDADSSLNTVDVHMAEEVAGNVHLTWKNTSTEYGDGIEVCRADSENGNYEIIATITDESYGYLKDGYIDQGAAGKGYYYGVRLLKGNSHSAMGRVMKAVPTEHHWFMNDNSYLRVIHQPDDPNYMIQFSEFDLSGNRTWNCDWPCMENQDIFTWYVDETEYTRTFQYYFVTPMEYDEMGAEPFTYYANMDGGEFTLTMYHYDNELYLPVFDDTIYSSIN